MPDTNNENLTVTASDEPERGVYVDKLVDKHDRKYRIYDYRLEDGLIDGSIYSGRDINSPGTDEVGAISAGTKAFTWSSATGTTCTKGDLWVFNIIGSLGEGQSVGQGEYVSVKADASESYIGTLHEAIDHTSTQVKITLTRNAVQKWTPMASNVCRSEEEGYLWFPGHPEIGAVDIDKGIEAITFGYGTRANEEGSFAVGRFNEADGRYSFASGRQNKVGYGGTVSGRKNKNLGMQSAVSGTLNVNNGANALISGYNNSNYSAGTVIGGSYNRVSGPQAYSVVIGKKLDSQDKSITKAVFGRYNYDVDQPFIIGGGNETTRKNLAVIDTDGNLHLSGSVYINSNGRDGSGSKFTTGFYGECQTPSGTATKEVSIPGITTLESGLSIRIKFDYENTADNATLKVNSLAAANIKKDGANNVGASSLTSWCSGQVVSLTYDGTYWQMEDYQSGYRLKYYNTTTSDYEHRVVLSYSANDNDATETARKSGKLTFKPSEGKLTVGGEISSTTVTLSGNSFKVGGHTVTIGGQSSPSNPVVGDIWFDIG